MARFTEDQAKASKIVKIQKVTVNDTFSSWKAMISGSDGQMVSIRLGNTDADANIATLKSEIIAELTGSHDYTVPKTPAVVTTTRPHAANDGDTLG